MIDIDIKQKSHFTTNHTNIKNTNVDYFNTLLKSQDTVEIPFMYLKF